MDIVHNRSKRRCTLYPHPKITKLASNEEPTEVKQPGQVVKHFEPRLPTHDETEELPIVMSAEEEDGPSNVKFTGVKVLNETINRKGVGLERKILPNFNIKTPEKFLRNPPGSTKKSSFKSKCPKNKRTVEPSLLGLSNPAIFDKKSLTQSLVLHSKEQGKKNAKSCTKQSFKTCSFSTCSVGPSEKNFSSAKDNIKIDLNDIKKDMNQLTKEISVIEKEIIIGLKGKLHAVEEQLNPNTKTHAKEYAIVSKDYITNLKDEIKSSLRKADTVNKTVCDLKAEISRFRESRKEHISPAPKRKITDSNMEEYELPSPTKILETCLCGNYVKGAAHNFSIHDHIKGVSGVPHNTPTNAADYNSTLPPHTCFSFKPESAKMKPASFQASNYVSDSETVKSISFNINPSTGNPASWCSPSERVASTSAKSLVSSSDESKCYIDTKFSVIKEESQFSAREYSIKYSSTEETDNQCEKIVDDGPFSQSPIHFNSKLSKQSTPSKIFRLQEISDKTSTSTSTKPNAPIGYNEATIPPSVSHPVAAFLSNHGTAVSIDFSISTREDFDDGSRPNGDITKKNGSDKDITYKEVVGERGMGVRTKIQNENMHTFRKLLDEAQELIQDFISNLQEEPAMQNQECQTTLSQECCQIPPVHAHAILDFLSKNEQQLKSLTKQIGSIFQPKVSKSVEVCSDRKIKSPSTPGEVQPTIDVSSCGGDSLNVSDSKELEKDIIIREDMVEPVVNTTSSVVYVYKQNCMEDSTSQASSISSRLNNTSAKNVDESYNIRDTTSPRQSKDSDAYEETEMNRNIHPLQANNLTSPDISLSFTDQSNKVRSLKYLATKAFVTAAIRNKISKSSESHDNQKHDTSLASEESLDSKNKTLDNQEEKDSQINKLCCSNEGNQDSCERKLCVQQLPAIDIRQGLVTQNIPAVIITATESIPEEVRSTQSNIVYHVVKHSSEELVDRITDYQSKPYADNKSIDVVNDIELNDKKPDDNIEAELNTENRSEPITERSESRTEFIKSILEKFVEDAKSYVQAVESESNKESLKSGKDTSILKNALDINSAMIDYLYHSNLNDKTEDEIKFELEKIVKTKSKHSTSSRLEAGIVAKRKSITRDSPRSTLLDVLIQKGDIKCLIRQLIKNPSTEIVLKSYQLLDEKSFVQPEAIDKENLRYIDEQVYRTYVNPEGLRGVEVKNSNLSKETAIYEGGHSWTPSEFYDTKSTQCCEMDFIPETSVDDNCSDLFWKSRDNSVDSKLTATDYLIHNNVNERKSTSHPFNRDLFLSPSFNEYDRGISRHSSFKGNDKESSRTPSLKSFQSSLRGSHPPSLRGSHPPSLRGSHPSSLRGSHPLSLHSRDSNSPLSKLVVVFSNPPENESCDASPGPTDYMNCPAGNEIEFPNPDTASYSSSINKSERQTSKSINNPSIKSFSTDPAVPAIKLSHTLSSLFLSPSQPSILDRRTTLAKGSQMLKSVPLEKTEVNAQPMRPQKSWVDIQAQSRYFHSLPASYANKDDDISTKSADTDDIILEINRESLRTKHMSKIQLENLTAPCARESVVSEKKTQEIRENLPEALALSLEKEKSEYVITHDIAVQADPSSIMVSEDSYLKLRSNASVESNKLTLCCASIMGHKKSQQPSLAVSSGIRRNSSSLERKKSVAIESPVTISKNSIFGRKAKEPVNVKLSDNELDLADEYNSKDLAKALSTVSIEWIRELNPSSRTNSESRETSMDSKMCSRVGSFNLVEVANEIEAKIAASHCATREEVELNKEVIKVDEEENQNNNFQVMSVKIEPQNFDETDIVLVSNPEVEVSDVGRFVEGDCNGRFYSQIRNYQIHSSYFNKNKEPHNKVHKFSASEGIDNVDDDLSDGEVRTKCGASVGEIHVCTSDKTLKSARYFKRHPEQLIKHEFGDPYIKIDRQRVRNSNWITYYLSRKDDSSTGAAESHEDTDSSGLVKK